MEDYLKNKFEMVNELLQYYPECNNSKDVEWTFESLANLPNEKLSKKLNFLREAYGEGCTENIEINFKKFMSIMVPQKTIKL